MGITLDHTIVPSHDKEASARFFANLFGLEYKGMMGHFAPVQINDSLAFDFDDAVTFESHHYAFHLDDSTYDALFARIKGGGVAYGSGPFTPEDGNVNRRNGGRGFYFFDLNGHLLEVMTRRQPNA